MENADIFNIQEFNNLFKQIQAHTVLLVDKTDIKDAEFGTGFFLKYNDDYFVLTAKHVIENVEEENLLIWLGLSEQQYELKKEVIWKHEFLDIAYIKLKSFEVQIFSAQRLKPFELRRKNLRNYADGKYRAAVCGFPTSLMKKDINQKLNRTGYGVMVALYTTSIIPPAKWPDEKDIKTIDGRIKTPVFDIMLKYSKEALDHKGERKEMFDVHGMSGAGIWLYDPTTENSENPIYELFAIQNSIIRDKKIVVGTLISHLFNQIEKDYGN